jgi:hypothetical protein
VLCVGGVASMVAGTTSSVIKTAIVDSLEASSSIMARICEEFGCDTRTASRQLRASTLTLPVPGKGGEQYIMVPDLLSAFDSVSPFTNPGNACNLVLLVREPSLQHTDIGGPIAGAGTQKVRRIT